MKTKFEVKLESIIQVGCFVKNCKHNFINYPGSGIGPHCNLKHIDLDENGVCKDIDWIRGDIKNGS